MNFLLKFAITHYNESVISLLMRKTVRGFPKKHSSLIVLKIFLILYCNRELYNMVLYSSIFFSSRLANESNELLEPDAANVQIHYIPKAYRDHCALKTAGPVYIIYKKPIQ